MRALLLVTVSVLLLAGCSKSISEPKDESKSFSAIESPQITKWANGRIFATCSPGYHFQETSSPFTKDSAGLDVAQDTMECAPNPQPPHHG